MTLVETLSNMPAEDLESILESYAMPAETSIQELADLLLTPAFMELFIRPLPSAAIALFDDASDASLQESCAIAPNAGTEVSLGYTLKQSGYADVQFEEADVSEDGHSHISFLYVPEDVAALFKQVYTPEVEAQRLQYTLLNDSCFAGKVLYGIAPVAQVLRIYDRLRLLYPECPRLKEENFLSVFDTICAAEGCHELYVHNDQKYVIGPGDDYAEEGKLTRAEEIAEILENSTESFYIPGIESLRNMADTGADLSLKPYQELKQFLHDFYNGKLADSPKPDESDGMPILTQDDIDDCVYELLSEIWFLLSNAEETEVEVMQDEQSVFEQIGSESRVQLMSILKNCSDVTYRILLRGRNYANRSK